MESTWQIQGGLWYLGHRLCCRFWLSGDALGVSCTFQEGALQQGHNQALKHLQGQHNYSGREQFLGKGFPQSPMVTAARSCTIYALVCIWNWNFPTLSWKKADMYPDPKPPILGPVTVTPSWGGYAGDLKPAVTSMDEFELIAKGSSLVERS